MCWKPVPTLPPHPQETEYGMRSTGPEDVPRAGSEPGQLKSLTLLASIATPCSCLLVTKDLIENGVFGAVLLCFKDMAF